MGLPDIDDDDVKAFLVESYENLNQIEQNVLNLEKTSANRDILVSIYRSIHTIKGNCGFLAFAKLESLAHAAENLLGGLRAHQIEVNSGIINALLQTVDSIRQILTHIEAEGNEGDRDISKLIKMLASLSEHQESIISPQTPRLDDKEQNLSFAIDENPGSSDTLNASDSSIRVDVRLLDQLMNLVGELVLARNQIVQFSTLFEDTAFSATCQRLNQITTELHEGIMKTRMQPINTIWQKLPRVTRDLAIANGKQVRVEMEGAETELDKSIIEAIKDPLTHLVRNSIDHGIETPSERKESGKPEEGRLLLQAFHESDKVNIEISDDGSGIDPERLKQKAQQLGLMSSSQVAQMSEKQAMDLIFLPGFSTAERVTNLSGRGVGMDVVKTNIEKINGTVEIQSQLGQGTTFKIKIPLTLAIIPALIVTSTSVEQNQLVELHRFAIPQSSIQELVRLEPEQAIHSIEMLYNVPVFRLRNDLLPLIYLNRELEIPHNPVEDEPIYIVVIQAEGYHFGLVVDAIQDIQDIVIKPLDKQLKTVTIFTGATILGDGKIALVIDAITLAQHAGITYQMQKQLLSTLALKAQEQEETRQTILLFDGPQESRMGIPLSYASRLEEFRVSVVEKVANQYIVQHQGSILYLLDLHSVFSDSGVPKLNHLTRNLSPPEKAEEEIIQVVVVTLNQQQSIGLVVERILDIVEEPLTIKGTPTRAGVLCLAVIQGQVTEILDIKNLIEIVYPYFNHQPLSPIP
ncbi:chemotaxis protein CheA [Aetokthonos hydrillicola Thurmond2011]|jgi:two-component system chemotaxis sensor kinase CheA|uniref:histidine kinase n=1 Tax=Aetokthonos hydrillicola Thurmond2011 TaxID=2712845 RepID=A0AAP5I2M6_9CYAN|nr:chemotaxis protein CheA [Aetokthonos hydrillicola]MBO3459344.1 chemotaxis protein CheA [Aetokthonos hydrillicola CCALA 1050]MBW4586490.1 chemotaxis protein CheA [Aetokthonos hydrillicola CCALA 1050]MDR9893566.1 chemotaxis protein CheA [Aetokthonos hydrillicola Thurmond2011]